MSKTIFITCQTFFTGYILQEKSVSKQRDAGSIKLSGGALCLDFTNTVHCYGCEDPGEYLNTYQDLVAWSRRVGTISDDEAGMLSLRADRQPSEAKNTHKKAIDLREAIYGIFTIGLKDQSPDREDLAVFNKYLAETMMGSRVVETQDGFRWDMTGNKAKLDWILNPVIRSAADLLLSEEFRRIKKCADPTCGWLFLDISRNRSRRWCDMADCGNRAKASRFYKNKKRSNAASSPSKTATAPSKPKPDIQRHLL
jgi:predicted RNA-binding Zn ribbon-like protein